MDDPLLRRPQVQPLRLRPDAAQLARKMRNPPAAKAVVGKRFEKCLARQGHKFGRQDGDGIAMIGRLIEARLGQKSTTRPLQEDLSSG